MRVNVIEGALLSRCTIPSLAPNMLQKGALVLYGKGDLLVHHLKTMGRLNCKSTNSHDHCRVTDWYPGLLKKCG